MQVFGINVSRSDMARYLHRGEIHTAKKPAMLHPTITATVIHVKNTK